MILYHGLQEPARTIDMVPKQIKNSLLIAVKFSDAKYVSIVNEEEVNIYDSNDVVITLSKQ